MKRKQMLACFMTVVMMFSSGLLCDSVVEASEDTTGESSTSNQVDVYEVFEAHNVTIEGVDNVRDIGGYYTKDRKYMVREGMAYRGAALENITVAGKDAMLRTYHIATDLDLRNEHEVSGGSPLGDSVNYINVSGPYYMGNDGIFSTNYKEALLTEIRAFAHEENYPIYFHCQIGRDRTGTLAFLINALLGVSEEDLKMDYRLSFYTEEGVREYSDNQTEETMLKNVEDLINALNRVGEETLAENTEQWMLRMGITQEEINSIRSIMLEEVEGAAEVGMTDKWVIIAATTTVIAIVGVTSTIFIVKKSKKKAE